MDIKETVRRSKFLSLVLRHQPARLGISLDEHGWTDVAVLLREMVLRKDPLTRDELEELVRTNEKQRFAFNEGGDKIRAS